MCYHALLEKKKVYEYGGFVLCVGAQGSQRVTVVSQTPDVAVGNKKCPLEQQEMILTTEPSL